MKKIYLDTLKNYFTSYIGYLFLSLSLLTASATFLWFNVMLRSVDVALMIKYTSWVVIFLLPFLTIKTVNRKNILPKHFAGLTLLLMLTVIIFLFAIAVMLLGNPSFMHILGLYIGFFMLIATFLALSTLIAILVRNAAISFIVTILLFAIIRSVDFFFSSNAIVSWLSAFLRFEPFLNGVFSLTSLVYYLTAGILVIFCTLAIKRGGVSAILSSCIALAMFFAINIFTTTYPIGVLVNNSSVFELSEATLTVLQQLDTPVSIIMFNPDEDIEQLITKYADSSVNIQSYSEVRSEVAAQFGVVGTNSVVVESDGKFILLTEKELYVADYMTKQYIALQAEDKITSAIAHIDDTEKSIACTGGIDDLLGIKVETVDLAKEDIPKDTDVFLIVAPESDFSKKEIDKLDTYLEKGGAVQVYFDVDTPSLDKLTEYLGTWGIKFEEDYVLDNDYQHNYAGKITLLIPEIVSHPITDELIGNRESIIAPSSRSITLQETSDTVSFELLKTSSKSYGKTNKDSAVIEMEQNDLPGPLLVAAGATRDGGSILAFGTSRFIDSQNKDFITNAINWQVDPNGDIHIPAHQIKNTILNLTEEQVIYITTVAALLPMLVFLAGITMRMLRKPA